MPVSTLGSGGVIVWLDSQPPIPTLDLEYTAGEASFFPVFADAVGEPEDVQNYMAQLFDSGGESVLDEDADHGRLSSTRRHKQELQLAHADSLKRMNRKREYFRDVRTELSSPSSVNPRVLPPLPSSPPLTNAKKKQKCRHSLSGALDREHVIIDVESPPDHQGSSDIAHSTWPLLTRESPLLCASSSSEIGTLSILSIQETASSSSDGQQNEDSLGTDDPEHHLLATPESVSHSLPLLQQYDVQEIPKANQKHTSFRLDELKHLTQDSDVSAAKLAKSHSLINEEERNLLVNHGVVNDEFAFLLEELFELNADKEMGMMSREMLFMFYSTSSHVLHDHKKLFEVKVVKYPTSPVSNSTKKSIFRLVSPGGSFTPNRTKPEGNSYGTPSALLSSKSDKMKAKKLGVLRIVQGLVHISNPHEAYDYDEHDGLVSGVQSGLGDAICFVPLSDRLECVHTDILTLLTAYVHMCFDNTALFNLDPKFCLDLCEASCQALRNFTRNPRNRNFIVTHHLFWPLVDAFRKSLPPDDQDFGTELSLSISAKLIDILNNVLLQQREVDVVRIEVSLIKEERIVQGKTPEIIARAMRASSNHFFSKAVMMARRFCPLFPDKCQGIVVAMLQRLCRAARGDDRFVRIVGEALITMGSQSVEKKGIFARTTFPVWKHALDLGAIPIFAQLMFHEDVMISEKAILTLMAMCNKKLDTGGSSDLVYRPLVSLLLKALPEQDGPVIVSMFEELIVNVDKSALMDFKVVLAEFREAARQKIAKEIPPRFLKR